jgi:gas vesicle protein
MSVIEIPRNIDFTVNVNIGTILFDKLNITNAVGAMTVRDGTVFMQNIGMNLLEGRMTLNGEYNTQNINTPFINFDMDISRFDITSALSSFSLLETILPEPQNYAGRVSAKLNLYGILDENLSPLLNTVQSNGRLQTFSLELRNAKLFGNMADLLRNEQLRTPSPNNLNITYEIRDGRLWVEPIQMNISQANIEIAGDQGLDMTLNYRIVATMPTSVVGQGASEVLSQIPGLSSLREFRVVGLIGGTVTNPDIRLSVADMAATVTDALREQVEAVREQVVEAVTERVEEVVTQVREEVARQVEAIMSEAERQTENIRSTARQAAGRVRSEAKPFYLFLSF